MYRFRDSQYYQPPITPAEQKPRPSSQASTQRPATSLSRASKQSGPKEPLTLRAKSVPIHTHYKPPPKLNLPTPLECWSTQTPEQEVASLPATPPHPPSSKHESIRKSITPKATPISLPKSATPIATPQPSHPVVPMTPVKSPIVIPSAQPGETKAPSTAGSEKHVRVQSAKVRRESATRPQRPVKSAGPVRASPGHMFSPQLQTGEVRASPVQATATRVSPMPVEKTCFGFVWPQPDPFIEEEDMINRTTPLAFSPLRPSVPTSQGSIRPASSQRAPSRPSIPSPAERPPSFKKSSLRPKAPSPYRMERTQEEEEEDYDIFRAETPDYDTELRKHGWLMEVHGNPLNLK